MSNVQCKANFIGRHLRIHRVEAWNRDPEGISESYASGAGAYQVGLLPTVSGKVVQMRLVIDLLIVGIIVFAWPYLFIGVCDICDRIRHRNSGR